MKVDLKNKNICYFVGNGNLPENTAAGQISRNIAVGLLVDMESSIILDACVTLRNSLAIEFIKAQLVGRRMDFDLQLILNDLDRYQSSAQKAVMVAIKAAFSRYKDYKSKNE